MAARKKLTAAELIDLDIKAMLRGGLRRFGGAERLGELLADLGDSETEEGMPTGVPDAVRQRVLMGFAQILAQHGEGGAASGLADEEAVDARLAQLNAQLNAQPAEEPEAFDDDSE